MSVQRKEYPVVIDYGRELQEVGKEGEYDYLNPNLTSEHFPTQRTGEAKATITAINFGRIMDSSDDVVAELDKLGLRPAETIEQAALGSQHPEVQRELTYVVALGTSWANPGGHRLVGYLYGSPDHRYFDLYRWNGRWRDCCWFAAAAK